METDGSDVAIRRQKPSEKLNLHTSTGLPPIDSSTLISLADVGQRGFSRKLHEMVRQQKEMESCSNGETRGRKRREKVELKNWKQMTPAELSKLTPMQKSRYMMYEPTSKEILEKQMESLKRVRARKLLAKVDDPAPLLKSLIEHEENSELIGQLKAAEARYRVRNTQLTYDMERSQELQHLIASQQTAQEAVRLQTFIPPTPLYVEVPDYLNKTQRNRCEEILEDDRGLTIYRNI
ncbi:PREDICTED: protein LKAAEAR1-like [Amphimedon queenslandica]|uniref:Uncharacterized protein n=1 Tax=Amphimedon queenslandica TaxID=400682 RepID=A0A1X7UKZ7_AMPQE|nr:PREDICTED: protein LKAAEAR1-like [Amphimedon queenslandica]|eukprot:XP_011404671.2 PREDICTED: protein LKAAEAR1-like [Amphimedon queenslandica]